MREIENGRSARLQSAGRADRSCRLRAPTVLSRRSPCSPFTSASASCSTAIMPRPSRSTLTMPMSAQSSLSHCTTTRPGMLAFSSGTTASSRPWQITMPPECWPRWRGRSCISRQSRANSRTRSAFEVEADRRQMPRQRVGRIDELEVVHHLREPIDLRRLEAERLPHLARRAAAAIGDDVGGHRRAEPAVLLVDVLDDPLAPIAARQIEIDVGPLAALLRQEALEQQIHPDRIDRRDAEAVADGAVGRRAAPLHEDVVLPAEVDDVPDDQEVAGELELLDEIELARDLRARAVVIRPVALARADLGDRAAGTTPASRRPAPDSRESGSRDPPSCTAADRRARACARRRSRQIGETAPPSRPAASDSARRSARAGARPARASCGGGCT